MIEPELTNRFERMGILQRGVLIGALCLASFVILFALAEGAVRTRAWLKHDQPVVRIEDKYHYNETIGLRLPVPGYSTPRLTINSLGFRGPELPRQKPSGIYRIAFLGGSTTFCSEVSGNDRTWPYLVVNDLKAAYPDRQFDYVNAGVPGYSTRSSLKRFEAEVRALKPDLVVIYHTTNDLSWNSRQIAKGQGLDIAGEKKRLTWLSKWSMLSYLLEKNLRILALQGTINDLSNKLKTDPSALARPFEQDLRELVRSVNASGAKVALISFSTHLRRNQDLEEKKSAANTALYYMPYMTPDSLLDAFDAYNQTIRKIAKEEKTIFIDAAMAIPGDSRNFNDSVHFTDQGAQVMAKVVSAELASVIH